MDKLAEAIKRYYQNKQELLTERDKQLELLNSISHEMKNGFLLSRLTGEIHRHYGNDLGRVSMAIQALEGVRNATD